MNNADFWGAINGIVADGFTPEGLQKLDHYAELLIFYHSDHLGSASWITEMNGDAVQHLQYLPYGERYVDQRVSGYHERFTFTGKERDEETGYGYFGARYMDHELMTMWLSVDPLADKYPGISPYAYCAWNPVKLVDPDGRDVYLSQSAQAIHDKYYGKKGYEEYTKLYDKLNNDHSIMVTVKDCNDNQRSITERGAKGSIFESDVEVDGFTNGCFEIEWGDPADSHGGSSEHVYMEEMCHMGQAQDKKYDIYSTTIDEEYSAKRFSISNCNSFINDTYDDDFKGAYRVPTELSIIRDASATEAKKYLLSGIKRPITRRNGTVINQTIGGHYDYLQNN